MKIRVLTRLHLLVTTLSVVVVGIQQMRLSELFHKIGRLEALTAGEQAELMQKTEKLESSASLVNSWVVPGSDVPFIRNLRAENIYIPSGEIRLGENPIGNGFSGVRIGFPAFSYNGELWNIVGVDNDVFQVGIRASDGKLVAGGGDVFLDEWGINFVNQEGALRFQDSGGSYFNVDMSISGTDALQLTNNVPGADILQFVMLTNETGVHVKYGEDNALANRAHWYMSPGAKGARMSIADQIEFRTESDTDGTYIREMETTVTPTNPGSGDSIHVYLKGDKLIIQFNDAGTVRYKYLDLTGTGVTWVHTTSAP